MEEIKTHNLVMDWGKFKGTRWTRLPIHYLKSIVNHPEHTVYTDLAMAELKRRGYREPKIEVSCHAVDQASKQCLDLWQLLANHREGLNSWLIRMGEEALERGNYMNGRYEYHGMRMVFKFGSVFPMLLTVSRLGLKN